MKRAPTSADWIFELKIDGYRLMVRRHEDKPLKHSRPDYEQNESTTPLLT